MAATDDRESHEVTERKRCRSKLAPTTLGVAAMLQCRLPHEHAGAHLWSGLRADGLKVDVSWSRA